MNQGLFYFSSVSKINLFFIQNSAQQAGIDGWVSETEYVIDKDAEAKIRLTPYDKRTLENAFANEIRRFGLATVETYFSAILTEEKSAAWRSVKLYYASFYAVHTLLRIFGISCSYFSSHSIREINKQHQISFGTPSSNRSNNFKKTTLTEDHKLILSELKDSHKDTWKTFDSFLKSLLESIATNSASDGVKTEAIQLLGDLQLTLGEKSEWLSNFRNDVNYKQANEVWHPHNKSRHNFHRLVQTYHAEFLADTTIVSIGETSKNSSFLIANFAVIQFMFRILFYNINRASEKNSKASNVKRLFDELRAV